MTIDPIESLGHLSPNEIPRSSHKIPRTSHQNPLKSLLKFPVELPATKLRRPPSPAVPRKGFVVQLQATVIHKVTKHHHALQDP